MAVKILSLGGTDWVDGEVVSHTDIIDTIEKAGVMIHEIYTGSGFDVSGIGDTDDHELNAITNTNSAKYTYVKISMTVKATASTNMTGGSTAQLKVQAKETGGAYADEFGFTTLCHGTYKGGGGDDNYSAPGISFGTVVWYHTLTAGEKTNGFQFKVFSQIGGTRSGTVTNIQTVVELL